MALSEGELRTFFAAKGQERWKIWEMRLDGAKEHEVSST
jgi:hypothetical protein